MNSTFQLAETVFCFVLCSKTFRNKDRSSQKDILPKKKNRWFSAVNAKDKNKTACFLGLYSRGGVVAASNIRGV